ncbi:MAG: hypothetical protein ABSE25_04410 [Syntrophorhabdales bacterium]
MSKFRFRFDRLIEVKEKLMEHKQHELEDVVREANALAEEARAIEKKISVHYDDMAARCITGEEFSLLIGSLAYLNAKKAAVMEEKQSKDLRIDALRAELIALVLELKVLERLRVNALKAAMKVAARKEQKLMDDIGIRLKR